MKLYYSPGACSLAAHIALLEAGFDFDLERVDLKSRITAYGADFSTVNSKGYVPALVLDDGEVVTENIAVLDWIAAQFADLGVEGPLGRTRLLETLGFISTEIHKGFKPIFTGASPEEKARAEVQLIKRLRWIGERLQGRYLFGERPTVADFYLFVTLRWAAKFGIAVPEALAALEARIAARPESRAAIEYEEGPALRTGSL